jgi:hypothetical protein
VKKVCAEIYLEISVASTISIAETQYVLRSFNKIDGRTQHSGKTVAYDGRHRSYSTTQEQYFKFVSESTGIFRSEKILNVKIKVGK